MVALSNGEQLRQERMYAGVFGNPLGRFFFVDSVNGANGNPGTSRIHPFLTVARALEVVEAGDTIVCAPGGSEVLAATLACTVARVKIVCPVRNPESGYTFSGPGTLDLLTVSAADVHLQGLRFQRSAGAGSATAAVLTTAAAHRLVVRRCSFDYTDLTSAWSNYGIELTDSIEDVLVEGSVFRDCHRGVLAAVATGEAMIGPRIRDCEFWVGRATAFGVYSDPAGTGTLSGLVIEGSRFVEANGDGTAADDAWDGSDGTDATSGTFFLGARVDQGMVANCRAHTALAQAFNTLSAVDAGADVDQVSCSTSTGDDSSAAVTSVGTLVSTAISAAQSTGTLVGSVGTQAGSVGTQVGSVGTQAGSVGTQAGSVGTLVDSVGTQAGSVGTLVDSVGTQAGSVGTQAGSIGTQAGSVGTLVDSVGTQAGSVGTQAGSVGTLVDSVGTQAGSVGTQAGSVGTQAGSVGTLVDSVGTQAGSVGTQAGSVGTLVDSVGTQAGSVGTLVQALGKPVAIAGSLADTAIDNNVQGAGNTIATAAGDVLIEDVIVSKDATAFTGPSNLELSSDNVYGDTGVNDPVAAVATATLAASTRIAALGTAVWSTLKLPMVLESGKKLYLHGDDLAGTSGGNTRFCVVGRALSVGGSLS